MDRLVEVAEESELLPTFSLSLTFFCTYRTIDEFRSNALNRKLADKESEAASYRNQKSRVYQQQNKLKILFVLSSQKNFTSASFRLALLQLHPQLDVSYSTRFLRERVQLQLRNSGRTILHLESR